VLTYAIETWGCQMSVHDSERLEAELRSHGLEQAGPGRAPDLVLLNTCSVRERPVNKLLARIADLARADPPPVIGVCGCVAQQEGDALLGRSPAVGFVLGPRQVTRVGEALRLLEQGRRVVLTGFKDDLDEGISHSGHRSVSWRAMVTVAEGCSECCTFCVVPYTRGPEISRPLATVLDEVRSLVADGVLEVELLGQTINSYACPETNASFSELLDRVARVEGLRRVRFITSHPRHFDDRLIDVVARHPSISRYLHLPIQSGADEILRRMRRRYTRDDYLNLVRRIRGAIPDVNVSTDVIVGFPGETEADFLDTLGVLESVRFGQVFAFAYSPRPRTPAARLDSTVSNEVAKDRLHRLFELADRVSHELNRDLVGRVVPVLVDGDSRRSSEDWQGRGDDNRVVNFPKAHGGRVGEIVDVRIVRAGPHSLYGEAVIGMGGPP